jgi:hypothetical protein
MMINIESALRRQSKKIGNLLREILLSALHAYYVKEPLYDKTKGAKSGTGLMSAHSPAK